MFPAFSRRSRAFALSMLTLCVATPAVAQTVFINEIHYDNDGADTGEFVEVAGPAGTDLSNWSILGYNGSNGTVYSTTNLSGSLDNEGADYGALSFAIAGLQNGAPDGVALVNNGSLVQFLCYEGSFTASNGLASGQTCTDIGVDEPGSTPVGQSLQLVGTGTQYADFSWTGPTTQSPGSLNSGQSFGAAVDTAPSVSSTNPTDGATGVAADATISIVFSEAVTVGNAFALSCASSGAQSFVSSTSDSQSYTLTPDSDLPSGELCTLSISASQVTDQDGTADAMAADEEFSFTVATAFSCAAPATLISTIQGSGSSSPEVGNVHDVEGVVIGDFQGSAGLRGFFLQEEDSDRDQDAQTSEGLFIYDPNTLADVQLGDVVRARGTVVEYNGLTELSSLSDVVVCSAGGIVSSTALSLPVDDFADWEAYEGMQVSFAQPLFVTEIYELGRYGTALLSSGDRLFQPTHLAEPGAPAAAVEAANAKNQILLDDGSSVQNPEPVIFPAPGLSASNPLRGGDSVTGLVGVLDYAFGAFRVHAVGSPNFVQDNPRGPAPARAQGSSLRVASFNVLNYFNGDGEYDGDDGDFPTARGADTEEELQRQRAKILAALAELDADIIGVMEIENDGYDALSAIADLSNGLDAAATDCSDYAYIDPGLSQIGSDEIAVGFLYCVDTVSPLGAARILDSSVDPAFIDTKNRPVLAQSFRQISSQGVLTIAVNHFKSKGSACTDLNPPDPDQGDGQGNCNATRTAAAGALVDWLATDPTGSGDADFLIIGDLNAYAKEDPISTIVNAGYVNLLARDGGDAAYSYVFDGAWGYLDHALATTDLAAQVLLATDWHINADEPIALDYNTNFKSAQQQVDFYAPDAYRSSDHDPVVIDLGLVTPTPSPSPTAAPTPTPTSTPTPTPSGPFPLNFQADHSSLAPGESVTLSWDAPAAVQCQSSGNWPDRRQPPSGNVSYTPQKPRTYRFDLSCTDAQGAMAQESVEVQVQRPVLPPQLDFSVDRSTINKGESLTLTWAATDARYCRSSGNWKGGRGLSGSQTYTPRKARAYSFTLSCANRAGDMVQKTVGVTVIKP